MKIAIGADERTHLTDAVVAEVEKRGHEISLMGPLTGRKEHWPEVAQEVAETVAEGKADEGILFCWTGTGVSLPEVVAREILESWFNTTYQSNPEDDTCLAQIEAIEAKYKAE